MKIKSSIGTEAVNKVFGPWSPEYIQQPVSKEHLKHIEAICMYTIVPGLAINTNQAARNIKKLKTGVLKEKQYPIL